MNELLFLLQVLLAFSCTYLFFRIGKEGLFVWLGMLALLANLFVSKQITLFGLEVTASDAFAVALILSLNLLQEFYGATVAKKGGMIAVAAQLAFLLFSELHLAFTPNQHDTSHAAYQTLLGIYPRLLFASCFTLFVVQWFDRSVFTWLKNQLPQRSFSARNVISVSMSQCLDTAIFSVIGLYGLVANITEVFLMSFGIKVLLILMLPLFTSLLKKSSYGVQV
ncbi:MAG: queuosine precursor transporter [Parachlamydiaceae bacterium]